jgi:hypothetical protein
MHEERKGNIQKSVELGELLIATSQSEQTEIWKEKSVPASTGGFVDLPLKHESRTLSRSCWVYVSEMYNTDGESIVPSSIDTKRSILTQCPRLA